MTNTRKRVLRTLLTLLITPFALVLVLGILLYLPPIQRWAVRQAASYLSSQTGIEVTLDRVRLSFPLDVSLGGVRAVQDGDTLLAVNSVLVDLDMKRLLSLSIGVDAVELADGTLHNAKQGRKTGNRKSSAFRNASAVLRKSRDRRSSHSNEMGEEV